jgi:hypothetical protein
MLALATQTNKSARCEKITSCLHPPHLSSSICLIRAHPGGASLYLPGFSLSLVSAVTFLSTWASDRRKGKRERGEKQIDDTRAAASELLKIGRDIETSVMMQETKNHAKPPMEYLQGTIEQATRLKRCGRSLSSNR